MQVFDTLVEMVEEFLLSYWVIVDNVAFDKSHICSYVHNYQL